MPRPTTYEEWLGRGLALAAAEGRSLRELAGTTVPHWRQVSRWANARPHFARLLECGRALRRLERARELTPRQASAREALERALYARPRDLRRALARAEAFLEVGP